MRLAFWRTEKPVARPVLQPGADSPYVPRLGVWMEKMTVSIVSRTFGDCVCSSCGGLLRQPFAIVGSKPHLYWRTHEGCGAKLVAQLRREREG